MGKCRARSCRIPNIVDMSSQYTFIVLIHVILQSTITLLFVDFFCVKIIYHWGKLP